MELNTERLIIIPLTLIQFNFLLQGTDKMEKALGLFPSGEQLDEHTQQAMETLYQKATQNSKDILWNTNWQIIRKSDKQSIGSASFMGSPERNGTVEIGYGMNERHRNHGYMTEAAKAMCEWAICQPGVTSVIAETEKDNVASHRVLEKCAMKIYRETNESIWYQFTACQSISL